MHVGIRGRTERGSATVLVLLFAILLSNIAAGCATKGTVDSPSLLRIQHCHDATGSCQWVMNYRFLENVSRGATPYAEHYGQAIEYFESVTGISAGISGTWAGRVLDRTALRAALDRWLSWCGNTAGCPEALELWKPPPVADPITGSSIK